MPEGPVPTSEAWQISSTESIADIPTQAEVGTNQPPPTTSEGAATATDHVARVDQELRAAEDRIKALQSEEQTSSETPQGQPQNEEEVAEPPVSAPPTLRLVKPEVKNDTTAAVTLDSATISSALATNRMGSEKDTMEDRRRQALAQRHSNIPEQLKAAA